VPGLKSGPISDATAKTNAKVAKGNAKAAKGNAKVAKTNAKDAKKKASHSGRPSFASSSIAELTAC
jgi:hypothetical protein